MVILRWLWAGQRLGWWYQLCWCLVGSILRQFPVRIGDRQHHLLERMHEMTGWMCNWKQLQTERSLFCVMLLALECAWGEKHFPEGRFAKYSMTFPRLVQFSKSNMKGEDWCYDVDQFPVLHLNVRGYGVRRVWSNNTVHAVLRLVSHCRLKSWVEQFFYCSASCPECYHMMINARINIFKTTPFFFDISD